MRKNWTVDQAGLGLQIGDKLEVHSGGIHVIPLSPRPPFDWTTDPIAMGSSQASVTHAGGNYTIEDDGLCAGKLTCNPDSVLVPSWTAVEGGNGCTTPQGAGGGSGNNA